MKTQIKFTPLQRCKIYRKALAMIESRECTGLCHALFTASGYINSIYSRYDFSIDFFPEIKKHEVTTDSGWWFPLDEFGRTQRITILEIAIQEAAVKHLEKQK